MQDQDLNHAQAAGAGRRSQMAWSPTVRDFILLTSGALILAINVDLFLVPADLAPGGVSGLAIILRRQAGWPIGLTMLVLNLPMLVLGFFNLGRFHFLV
ncbi:MAG TPA: YitT family protein, partial [Anaerolineales bacterium]|nr:YitT family protein [Anaerolineales bacterium]